MLPPHPLAPERLAARCDPATLGFETTATLPEPAPGFGQARAIEALRLALDIGGAGYNAFVLGEPGSGRHALVRQLLQQHAATRPPAPDWCYVHNFADAAQPRALRLPAGQGPRLHQAMEGFVAELGKTIDAALDSDEYRARVEAIEKDFKAREEQPVQALAEAAAGQGVVLLRTPQGLVFAPIKDGEPLDRAAFDQLPEAERQRIDAAVRQLSEQLEQLMQALPRLRRERHARLRAATREAMALAAGHLVDELKQAFAQQPTVLGFLDEVLADVIETGGQAREPAAAEEGVAGIAGALALQRYRVNALVTHAADGHAPVVALDHPTCPNLIGRVDHRAHLGTLLTDFTLIRAGALHRANGGYLMIDAAKLLVQPFAWEALKRALASARVDIESPAQELGLAGTPSLEPQPIELAIKVVLLGERHHYELLQAYDPEFGELFKVAADFEDEAPRDAASVPPYLALLGAIARAQGLRPLDRSGAAAMVDHGSRLAGDARKLSLQLRELEDVLREADHAAGAAGRAAVAHADVRQAIAARLRRVDRPRERLMEALRDETLAIATGGASVGQVNGLSVHESAGFRFARPVRISATARIGEGRLIDIERESMLGQPLHTKGVLILANFLAARFAHGVPLSLAASLVFEQTYGPVEGDSASLAELCALLSALAGVPVRQSLAVTGSVNQRGGTQAVGAVNEKIEGFFDLCQARGLDGSHGVLIPASCVQRLMLREDVVEAARQGRFGVYAVADVDDAMELLTGMPAGRPDSMGRLREGTLNRLVAEKLAQLFQLRLSFGTPHSRDELRPPHRMPPPVSIQAPSADETGNR